MAPHLTNAGNIEKRKKLGMDNVRYKKRVFRLKEGEKLAVLRIAAEFSIRTAFFQVVA